MTFLCLVFVSIIADVGAVIVASSFNQQMDAKFLMIMALILHGYADFGHTTNGSKSIPFSNCNRPMYRIAVA